GHLRGSHQGQHAVRANQDSRAAERPVAPPHAPSVHPSADRGDQRDPGSSCRVRDCCAGWAPRCRGTALCRSQVSDGPTVPTIVFHGDRDNTVHPSNGDHVLEQSIRTTRTQKKVHRGQAPGGHAYTRTIHTDAGGREIFWALEHSWSWTRMVRRQPCWLLHGSARTGRHQGNAAVLPRAFPLMAAGHQLKLVS